MRARSVKHVEFEILKYLLTEEGANLANPRGLSDLFVSMGADFDEWGHWTPMNEAKDKPAQKRCRQARKNIAGVLVNMMAKRTAYLPDSHTDLGCDREDLVDTMRELVA